MTRKRLLNNNNTTASSTTAPVKRRKRRRRSDAATAVSRDSCSDNDNDDDDEDERRSTDVNNAKSLYCENNNEQQQHNSSGSGAIQGLVESSTSTSSIGTRSSFNIGATLDAPTGEDEVEWKEWPSHGMHERPVYHPQFGLATEHNGRYFVNRPDDKGYDEVKIDDVAQPVPKFVPSSCAASRRQVATAASAKSSVAPVATVTATIATTSRRQRAADGTVTTRPVQAIAYVAPSQHQQQQQQQTPQLLQQQKKQPIVLSSLDRSKVMAYLAHRAQQFGEAQHQLLQSYNLSQQRKLELLQQRLNSRPRLLQVQLSKNKNVAAVLQAATAATTTTAKQQQSTTATVAAAATGANTATAAAAAAVAGKAIPASGRIITQDMLRSWREANQQKLQHQHQTPGKILLMPSRPLQQQQQQQTSTNSNAAIGAPLTMPFCGVPALNGNGKVFFVRAPDLAKKLKSSEKPFTVTSTSSPPSSSSTPTSMSHQHHHHHHHHHQQQQQQHPHNHHNHHQHHPMATTTTMKRVAMPWVPDMNLLVRNNPVAAVAKQQQQQTFRTISPSEATILMPKSCHNTNGVAVSNNFAYSQPYYVLDLSKKESTTTPTHIIE
ncbi:protein roadkill-like [Trichogramma pretiosum]|uniref:protein roadkill-like n=1 Tax=Trichogramma pretiosum TaxID=7493 RepID=UPI000C71AAFE|nr:protein roadkill-like [Trichogramma pretiosum]